MSTNTVSASVPIKVARQNYYATLAIDVQRSLAQTWDDGSQKAFPDWGTDASKRPILTPVINCPASLSPSIVSIEWFRDGVSIGSTVSVADPSSYSISTSGVLTILKNLASSSNTDPDTFTCKVAIRVNGVIYNLERSVSATILPASADGYAVVIDADRTALSSETGKTSCTLTATLYYKNNPTTDGVTYKWLKGATQVSTNQALSVSRSDVDWEQLFRVEVSVNGVVHGVGAIVVTDQADNYALAANVSGDVTDTTPATVSVQLQQRKTGDSAWENFGKAASYTATLYDVADTDAKAISTGTLNSSGKGSFTVGSAQMASAGIEAGYVDIVATWT